MKAVEDKAVKLLCDEAAKGVSHILEFLPPTEIVPELKKALGVEADAITALNDGDAIELNIPEGADEAARKAAIETALETALTLFNKFRKNVFTGTRFKIPNTDSQSLFDSAKGDAVKAVAAVEATKKGNKLDTEKAKEKLDKDANDAKAPEGTA